MERLYKGLKKTARVTFLVLYAPVYIAFYVLHKAARALLALGCFGMFDFRMGWDILKCLFGPGIYWNDAR